MVQHYGRRRPHHDAHEDGEEASCPKCGSTSIHVDKKGFSAGKTCLGFVTGFGCLAPLCGFCGANKLRATCLKCGHSWRV